MDKKAAFYKKLKIDLEETTKFPTKYLYKFIVPSDEEKIQQVETTFDHMGAVITKKSSKTGKFISISILVKMNDADEVIKKYKEVEIIDGIISL
jgi:putative lipoic acid-binding regulatory protein